MANISTYSTDEIKPATSRSWSLRNIFSSRAAWGFAMIAALYIGTIGALPLLGKDEPRYVEIAREMMQRGDWVTPILGGQAWFEKPSLLYWMVMASFHLFCVSEWAARLGPALCGLAAIGLVFWLARRVETESETHGSETHGSETHGSETHGSETHNGKNSAQGLALWSALSLASCAGLIAFSHGATFDIVLTATTTLALACFFVADLESAPPKRRLLLAGLWVGVGLALLAKGLAGIVLPGGVIFFYFALRRDWRGFGRVGVLWGLPLALIVSALWYGPVIARHGQAFVQEFFVEHHFARYTSNKFRHAQPLYYYLPVIALFALPWTLFLLAAVREVKPATWQLPDAQSKLRVFALAWLVFPIAFFSLSVSKLPGYILPALPGAMLLVGMSVAAYVRSENGVGSTRLTGVLLLVLGLGAAIYARHANAMNWPGIAAVVLPLLGAGLLSLAMAHRRALCSGAIVGAMLLATGLLTGFVGVPVGEKKSMRALLRAANARGYGRLPVWEMQTTQRSAEYYAAGRLTYDEVGEPKNLNSALEISRALSPGGEALVLVPISKINFLKQYNLLQSEMVAKNSDVALLRVRLNSELNHDGHGKH